MKKYLGYFFAGAALYFGFAGLGYAETTVSAKAVAGTLHKAEIAAINLNNLIIITPC